MCLFHPYNGDTNKLSISPPLLEHSAGILWVLHALPNTALLHKVQGLQQITRQHLNMHSELQCRCWLYIQGCNRGVVGMHYSSITWLLYHLPTCPVQHTKPSPLPFNLFYVKGSAPRRPRIQVVLCAEITRLPQPTYTHTHTHTDTHAHTHRHTHSGGDIHSRYLHERHDNRTRIEHSKKGKALLTRPSWIIAI